MSVFMWLPICLPITAIFAAATWILARNGKQRIAVLIGLGSIASFAVAAIWSAYRCILPTLFDPNDDMRIIRWGCSGHEKYIASTFTFIAAPISMILLTFSTIYAGKTAH